jgi:hypothetical protein
MDRDRSRYIPARKAAAAPPDHAAGPARPERMVGKNVLYTGFGPKLAAPGSEPSTALAHVGKRNFGHFRTFPRNG